MGLSASQARFLQLTARRSDNEFEAQQINNARSAIAQKMEDISMKYNNGLNNRQLLFVTPVNDGSTAVTGVKLTYNTITSAYPEGLGYSLVTKNGLEVRPNSKEISAMFERASREYDAACATELLQAQNIDENGNRTFTNIDGSNFLSLLGDKFAIEQNGATVNQALIAKNVAGMDAAQFGQYWNANGFKIQGQDINYASENTNGAIVKTLDKERIAKAEANLIIAKERLENQDAACHYDDRCMDDKFLQEQLRKGEWTLQKTDYTQFDEKGNPKKELVYYGDVVTIEDVLDTEDDAAYIAEYNSQMDYYQHKDKQLELQLQRLETSHNAIQTEIDSVKKVIETNVDKSFKTFG